MQTRFCTRIYTHIISSDFWHDTCHILHVFSFKFDQIWWDSPFSDSATLRWNRMVCYAARQFFSEWEKYRRDIKKEREKKYFLSQGMYKNMKSFLSWLLRVYLLSVPVFLHTARFNISSFFVLSHAYKAKTSQIPNQQPRHFYWWCRCFWFNIRNSAKI